MIYHSRIQHPVGHGFFHSSTIYSNSARFDYIYDCGGGKYVKKRVDQYLMTLDDIKRIDAIFISHFHNDHVNALDSLIREVAIEAVYMPYIDDVELMILATEAIVEKRDDFTYLSFLRDPVQWFKDHGGEKIKIIEIKGGDTGDFSALNLNENPPSQTDERKSLERRLEIKPYPQKASPTKNDTRISDNKPNRLHESIKDHQTGYALFDKQQAVWLLIPFVQEAEQDKLIQFEQDLKMIMDISPEYSLVEKGQWNKFWKAVLSDRIFRDKLRDAYKRIHSDFNSTSLCLYSGRGPQNKIKVSYHNNYFPTGKSPCYFCNLFSIFPAEKYAWIGTGDALLKNDIVLNQFKKHYGKLLESVHTLTLPHHGSRHNSGSELIAAVSPTIAVSTCNQSDPHHPSRKVIDEVVMQRAIPIQVTGDIKSQFEERVIIS